MKKDFRERLDVVFAYGVTQKKIGLVDGSVVFEEAAENFGVDGVSVFKKIVEYLKSKNVFNCTTIDGDFVSLDGFYSKIKKSGKWVIPVNAGGMSFRFGSVLDREHCFLVVQEIDFNLNTNWDELVSIFCDEIFFVQAWVSNAEFNFWQNQTDVDLFVKKGVSQSDLKIISNGLPPPLDISIVDISSNPGRRILRDGYVEAIGRKMWLSDLFWKPVGFERKIKIFKNDNFIVREKGSIVIVETDGICFLDDASRGKQLSLREALYG
ncbi:hypothetical protein OX459_12830 [Janthinobacterium sp. SUN026]|uniref:hypothetical protein n=1 Tax=Janthinobacterium sp. SUN026 TaxID=3002438 RepID=UPI0025B1CA2F|nr:hypothetical protein [Janthinobacterium sp. SUN026]MDN2672280.1 hypothetical protein [Janthinobacterium sp. SUN026]